jgi:hypothetical protein
MKGPIDAEKGSKIVISLTEFGEIFSEALGADA